MEPGVSTEEPVRTKCGKCSRPYKRAGKWFDEHTATCDGTPYDPSKATPGKRAAAKPTAPPSALDSTLMECRRAKESLGKEIVLVKAHLDRLLKEAASLDEVMQKIVEAKGA